MSVLVTVVEGWTKELGPFTLMNNGSPVALTGTTVALKLRSKASNDYIDVAGDVRVDSDQIANPGDVYYKPDVEDLKALHSPYQVRWEVTDSEGVVYFPNGDADTFVVKEK